MEAHDLRRLISKLNKVSEDSERTGFDEQFEVCNFNLVEQH